MTGVIGSLQDTIADLMMDAAGALLAGLVNLWALRVLRAGYLEQQEP